MPFHSAILDILNPETLLPALGPWVLIGIGVIIFIESGVLFPFLPGDSLIVTAAILSTQLGLTPWSIAIVAIVAAIAGDQVGYLLGNRFGRRLFKPDARILRTEYLETAERFFAKYGPFALVLGRFVPIVRTYVPLAAGTAALKYRRFVMWNVLGALLWVISLTLVGTLLGGIPFVRDNIDVLAIVIVLVSVLPVVIGALVRWRRERTNGPALEPIVADDASLLD
ncbi:DedA family protein [Gulosibacter sp. ACHW.36C]|uniref:VTT domain-containing protein n=1 Tax=Gulosibacter sediminis TaxID=1729695 RepID=A0ABY4MW81_9MICO|nr:VTT domain-containing protein [Gulosibacter sediminis]UQN14690.1 VTT domain-containing protein [Gulosibacter sediminis]